MGNHFQEEFVEEYLEAFHRLDKGDRYIKNNELAQQLSISPASVTEMVQRLAERGLVEYKRYYGAKLTRTGRKRAATIHTRHRMLELFLNQVLGLEGDQLHQAACRLEHALTPQLEQLMTDLVRSQAPEDLELPPCPRELREPGRPRLILLEALPPSSTARIKALLVDTDSQGALATLRLTIGRDITRLSSALDFDVGSGGSISLEPRLARQVVVEY